MDGFLRFFNKINSFNYQSDGGLIQWINSIMINECLSFLKKKNAFNMLPETVCEEMPFHAGITEKFSLDHIYKLILNLPVGCRTVFNLFVIEGFEHKEIANMLNISDITSRTQLKHARNLLQKHLKVSEHEYTISRDRSTSRLGSAD